MQGLPEASALHAQATRFKRRLSKRPRIAREEKFSNVEFASVDFDRSEDLVKSRRPRESFMCLEALKDITF